MQSDISEVVQKVIDGTATESETGLVLKTLQNSLGANLISGVSAMFNNMQSLSKLVEAAVVKLTEQFEMNQDLMDVPALMRFIQNVQSQQLSILELNRKITTGNQLFAEDTLSDEERKVLKLFKSFKTNGEKRRFMALVAKELGE